MLNSIFFLAVLLAVLFVLAVIHEVQSLFMGSLNLALFFRFDY